MGENEVSFNMHQQIILKAQELHEMMAIKNQESNRYIEDWFHSIICLQHHSASTIFGTIFSREDGFSYPNFYQHEFFKFGYVHTRGLTSKMVPLKILLYIKIFDSQRRVR